MDPRDTAALEAQLEEEGLENVRLRADRAGKFRYDRETRAWIAKKDRDLEDAHRDHIVGAAREANRIASRANDLAAEANRTAESAKTWARGVAWATLGTFIIAALAFAMNMGWL